MQLLTDKVKKHLSGFSLASANSLFPFADNIRKTTTSSIFVGGESFPVYTNEFWTAQQRQASSLHEIAYRACFKAHLPRFFIDLFTQEEDKVYDPFSGRGTTVVEAGLMNRKIIANDINPISSILARPRFFIPTLLEIRERLDKLPISSKSRADLDLSMFYHPKTEAEVVSMRNYFLDKRNGKENDYIDDWIVMVATNRLTGHSPGFFSVYTLPPNQAVSQESQKKINKNRNQKPEYRNTREIIFKKTKSLLNDVSSDQRSRLSKIGGSSLFLNNDARKTKQIHTNSIQLTVTSPPFLDVVQYAKDNWLRCWFNGIDGEKIEKDITQSRKIEDWSDVMRGVFKELYRITNLGGWVAFEVGEVRNKKIKLEEHVIPLGISAGFRCEGVMVNEQNFTKTSNIWGVQNNTKGTNTNRIVLFCKS